MSKYFLGKNDKNINENKLQGNDKLPYFSLYVVPEQKGGEWISIGVAWKSSSGKGYNLKFNEGVKVDTVNMKKFSRPQSKWVNGTD